ncbi:MAG: hypothetical protein AAB881_00435 [Patescibacteria group bacterium]
MLNGTRLALLICGDKWMEEKGFPSLMLFWHLPELSGLESYDAVNQEEAERRPFHSWQGGIGIYGFLEVEDSNPDFKEGERFLKPYAEKEKPGERRAFYLSVNKRYCTLFHAKLRRQKFVLHEICRVKTPGRLP